VSAKDYPKFKYCNRFIKGEAKKVLGLPNMAFSARSAVPEMKGDPAPIDAYVNLAIGTVPSAQSFAVGDKDNFEHYFNDWGHEDARAVIDQLNIDNANLVDYKPEPDAVDSLPSAGQLVVSVAPPTAEPKEYVEKACNCDILLHYNCKILRNAKASITGDGFLRFHNKIYKPASSSDTGQWGKANMFALLDDRS